MPGIFAAAGRIFVGAPTGSDIHLAANDGLYSVTIGLLIEVDGPEDIAVIRHGNGGHLIFLGPFQQILDADCTVQEAVLGVDMQVDERGVFHSQSNQ